MANKPAALENSYTSPLGTVLFFTASIVSCLETETIAVATALRRLFDFEVMSTIIIYSLSNDRFHLSIILSPKQVTQLLISPLFLRRHQSLLFGVLMM